MAPASTWGATAHDSMKGGVNEDPCVQHTDVLARGSETDLGSHDPRSAFLSW